MPRLYAALALGGVAGTLARYAVGQLLPASPAGMPRATLLVNLGGSVLLGIVLSHAVFAVESSPTLRVALAVGFCGAFTTMSSFAFEIAAMGQARQYGMAVAYAALTVAGSVAAVLVGLAVGRLVS